MHDRIKLCGKNRVLHGVYDPAQHTDASHVDCAPRGLIGRRRCEAREGAGGAPEIQFTKNAAGSASTT